MGPEKRRSKRIPVNLEVYWDRDSGKQFARITNLSMGGCFIKSRTQPPTGEPIELELHLPMGRWLPLEGVVAHCYPGDGFGVRFTSKDIGPLVELIHLLDKER